MAEVRELIGPRFARSEPWENAVDYLRGLLSGAERKNSWTLSEQAGQAGPDRMQRLLSTTDWDPDSVRDDLRSYVVQHLGASDGVLIVDETGFLKREKRSAGVARQYSGTVGRIENSQIGVFLTYSSPAGRTFLDRELYLPKVWTDDRERCDAAGVPATREFRTKPELAMDMLARALNAGVPARWVTGKKGLPQIEYGLLTDPEGRPVAIRVMPRNTADRAAFEQIAIQMKTTFGVNDMVMVAGRGMSTSARIKQLRELGGLGWVTALRSTSIAGLLADGSVQQSLFDEANLAEIAHPDYPAERLIACRNPALAERRAHKREDLLAATEVGLTRIVAAVKAGRLGQAGAIGIRVGKVVSRHNMAKHFTLTIADGQFTFTRDEANIDREAGLDGIYIIRTSVPGTTMDAGTVVNTYKSLARIEHDFHSIKSIDLDLRPIYHWTSDRVRASTFQPGPWRRTSSIRSCRTNEYPRPHPACRLPVRRSCPRSRNIPQSLPEETMGYPSSSLRDG